MGKKIAFYISDHNMEHVIRNIPLLQNILKIENDLQLFIKTGREQIALIKKWIGKEERLHYYEMEMKDRKRECWDALAEEEVLFLKEEKIGLVVSDICPWIFIAADELRIRSLLLGNYTWAELCEEEEEREDYLSCYEMAFRMFLYDLHTPELTGVGVEYELMSMMNRPYHMEKIESLVYGLEKPLVFSDISGEKNVDVSGLPYSFVVTEGCIFAGENVTVLSKDEKDLQDYVAASSYVIAEGGWNRIAEAVLANKKAAFLVNEQIPMSRQMVAMLKERQQCVEVTEDELSEIEKVIKRLDEFHYSYDYEYYNSDYDLAKKILFAYPEKRRRNRS